MFCIRAQTLQTGLQARGSSGRWSAQQTEACFLRSRGQRRTGRADQPTTHLVRTHQTPAMHCMGCARLAHGDECMGLPGCGPHLAGGDIAAGLCLSAASFLSSSSSSQGGRVERRGASSRLVALGLPRGQDPMSPEPEDPEASTLASSTTQANVRRALLALLLIVAVVATTSGSAGTALIEVSHCRDSVT
jgi:hypothetical protein